MEKPLKGKVAVVTGASRMRGLGRAIARALADAGADVVVTARGTVDAADSRPQDEKDAGWLGAQSVAEELRSLGVRAEAVALDVTRPEAVKAAIDAVESRLDEGPAVLPLVLADQFLDVAVHADAALRSAFTGRLGGGFVHPHVQLGLGHASTLAPER